MASKAGTPYTRMTPLHSLHFSTVISDSFSSHLRPESQGASTQTCPQAWTLHAGRCYILNTDSKVTWSEANRFCRERYGGPNGEQEAPGCLRNLSSCLCDGRYKGTLSSVLSKVDMDWLWGFGGRKPFWIGGCLEGVDPLPNPLVLTAPPSLSTRPK